MKPFRSSVFLWACLTAIQAGAASTSGPDAAIDHLITFAIDSKRTFIRNGQEYSASNAGELLRYKWNANKKQIATPEDFIRIAATKSSTSGKPYLVKQPDGKIVACADWLE